MLVFELKRILFSFLLREGVKYNFADFVRKGGTPSPLQIFFRQGGSYGFGVYPLPPFYGFFVQQKGGYGFGGDPPPPLRTKSAK